MPSNSLRIQKQYLWLIKMQFYANLSEIALELK
jgi:hypothetical protein